MAKSRKSTTVKMIDTISDPMQPSRDEKTANIRPPLYPAASNPDAGGIEKPYAERAMPPMCNGILGPRHVSTQLSQHVGMTHSPTTHYIHAIAA